MYLAVDIGGTKTLVAAFSEDGKEQASIKFATNPDYSAFLGELASNVDKLSTKGFVYACVAVPGRLDRDKGTALGFGNLKWGPQKIRDDIQDIIRCPVVIENDAKVAGLSEARQLKEFKTTLYITLGTGIGCALISKGVIDPAMADSEGGQVLVDHGGKMVPWEDVASGKAIVKRFGKRASDIDDEETWKVIAHDLSLGLIDLISVIQPSVIVLGGGVSTNFDKFIGPLEKELKKYGTPLVPIPPVRKAANPEKAVIYGCYELVKQAHEKTD